MCKSRLIAENQYYRAQLSGEGGAVPVTLSAEMARLTSDRAALIEENALYQPGPRPVRGLGVSRPNSDNV
jgi:hypothetical protein